MQTTKEQVTGVLQVVMAVTETIRELGSIPSGHLYARLMGVMTLEQYESIIRTIEGAGLIHVTPSHRIEWTGPKLKE